MKCPNCSEENLLIAQYCCSCGRPFTDKERKKAYDATIFGKVDKVRKGVEVVTLKVVTDSIWFKIATIAVIVILGFWLRSNHVNTFRLESSSDYEILYLEETKTYYLVTQADRVPVRLVAPKNTVTLTVDELTETGGFVFRTAYTPEEGVVLSVSGQNHYLLTVSDGKRNTGQLVLYVYRDN
ncbi:MAG: hypothetical protein IJH99_08665 [Eubacterium sp.]|nr:hypothetical protein [Eubacterium sp.]